MTSKNLFSGSLCISNVMTVDEYNGNYLACQEYNAYLDRTRTGSYSVIVVASESIRTLLYPSKSVHLDFELSLNENGLPLFAFLFL